MFSTFPFLIYVFVGGATCVVVVGSNNVRAGTGLRFLVSLPLIAHIALVARDFSGRCRAVLANQPIRAETNEWMCI